MITAKIDVTKIDKSRLFSGKNGAKYLDIVLIPTENDRYGNTHMVVQSISKEERQSGKKGQILGNAKDFNAGQSERGGDYGPRATRKPSNLDEDIPF